MDQTELRFHGRSLSVASSASEVHDVLRRLYTPYVVSGGHSPSPDVTVTGASSGWVIDREGADASVTTDDLAPELEHAVTQAMLKDLPEFLHLHGAAVGGRTGAIVALGPSGAGKSTITAFWSLAGRPVLGDDVVLLDRSRVLHPLMKPLKVDAARAPDLSLQLEETILWEPGSAEAWVAPPVHGGWSDPMPVRGLVLLDRMSGPVDEEAAVRMEPLSIPEGVQAVLGQLMTTGGRGADWIDDVVELVEAVGVHRLTFRNSRDAAERLAALDG